jgi:Protein of unknown function (DUF2750)
MLVDTATVQENHDRFVRRVLKHESVWGIRNERGFQGCGSNEDEERTILLFWSDTAYARRAVVHGYGDCEPAEISLFDFLFRWLPGLADDGLLVGTNYTAQLHGLEFEPLELREELIGAMSEEQIDRYQRRLDEALEAERNE